MDIIFDACTLILLAKINLLREVVATNHALTTRTIQDEILVKPSDDTRMIEKIIIDQFISVKPDPSENKIGQIIKDFRLGRGETTGLILTQERNGIFATDDGLCIKACKIFGIPFLTAIHFLIQMRQKDKLSKEEALVKLRSLSSYGRYQAAIIKDAESRLI